MVGFNEAPLHEATLNLHTHAIATVEGKQYSSEVVFSASVGFSFKENGGFQVVPVHPGLTGPSFNENHNHW